jgi:hypothetical protein
MEPKGAGSQRIVVIGSQAAPSAPTARREHDVHPPRESLAKKLSMQQTGWTTRRLTIAGALGAAGVLLGGIMFLSKFGVLGGNDSPILAMGFGAFAIGMVVFCAALVALLGTGIQGLVVRNGWPVTAAMVLGPLALAWAIYAVGAVGYAVPAVLSLVLIGGLVVALK